MSQGIAPAPAAHEVFVKPVPTAMVWSAATGSFEQIAVPGVALADGDVLVQMDLATVCPADTALANEQASLAPTVLGHEGVGRVAALGGAPRAACGTPLVVGMRVVWGATAACGECDRCLRGVSVNCRKAAHYGHDHVHRGWELSGTFATHVRVLHGTVVVLVDENIPSEVAALAACVTSSAVAGIDRAAAHEPLLGATVLIFGGTAVAFTACAIATDAGAHVVFADPDPENRATARDFGAGEVVDPTLRFSAPGGLASVLGARERATARECVVALDTTATTWALDAAVAVLGPGGLVVLAAGDSNGGSTGGSGGGSGANTANSGASSSATGAEQTGLLSDPLYVSKQLIVNAVSGRGGAQLPSAVRFLSQAWPRYPLAALVGAVSSDRRMPLARLDDAVRASAVVALPRVAIDCSPAAAV